ncbi:MAG: 3-deoxy-D-manno-octulosonic acid transferase [Syntrophobacteraceae bacterium]
MKDPEFKRGRLGFYDGLTVPAGKPRIWCHAVSVGEATGAIPVLSALRKRLPNAGISMTSGTPQGLKFALAQLPPGIAVFPFPLDFSKCVSRAISTIQPDLFIDFETEFWPNFFRELKGRNIPALLLNGRISRSSERLFRYLAPLFRPVFEQFTHMAMHSLEDMERALRIGVPPRKVLALGSSKYEGLAEKARPERAEFWKEQFSIGNRPVLIGGSLRGSESIELMRVFQQLRHSSAGLLGIFAPRHMKNIPKMCEWLANENIPYDLLTQIEDGSRARTAPVVLVDRIGALFEIYSVGDLIFCGGTFEPVGGHNILEPAAWSKAVFYGPHLKKVLYEHRILRDSGGSFLVLDPDDLLGRWKKWVGDLDGLRNHGAAANKALTSLKGVVDRQLELILESVPKVG